MSLHLPTRPSRFRCGEKVRVKCVEIECGPDFEGVITRIDFRNGEFDYSVYDLKNKIDCDGYSEDWLSHA